jgi:hypothetical protein
MDNNNNQDINMSSPGQGNQRNGGPTNYHPNTSGPGLGFGSNLNFSGVPAQDSSPAGARGTRPDGNPVSKSDIFYDHSS